MLWRRVQVWFPRVLTSGGQSDDREVVEELEALEVLAPVDLGDRADAVDEEAIDFLVRAVQSETEVQERHL